MATTEKNWVVGTTPAILKDIHDSRVNIAIYDRNTGSLATEISSLLQRGIEFKSSGDFDTILQKLTQAIEPDEFPMVIQDIKSLLNLFKEVTGAQGFRMLLATVDTNMCRKFHTDINDLRLLCTYSGKGTLWLTEDNVNRRALHSCGDNESIVIDESRIQHAKTGSVVILKGAIYPQEATKSVVHRSPTIEEDGEKRLLLRIDTHNFSWFNHDSTNF